jgi:hypothetical protein
MTVLASNIHPEHTNYDTFAYRYAYYDERWLASARALPCVGSRNISKP